MKKALGGGHNEEERMGNFLGQAGLQAVHSDLILPAADLQGEDFRQSRNLGRHRGETK